MASLKAIRRIQKQCSNAASLTALTVADLMRQTQQPDRLSRQLWEPLALAMLNTPIQQASAAVFANVLNATLFAGGRATELLIPKRLLGDVLPAPAALYLSRRGAEMTLNNRIQALLIDDNQVNGVIDQHGIRHQADAVILALPPSALTRLLSGHAVVSRVAEYPICTVYLQYAASVRPPQIMTGFSGTLSQWLFDRSFQQPGLMSVVISGPGAHTQLTKQQLIEKVCTELAALLKNWPQQAEAALVIREKRATFASTPDSQKARPACKTHIENLWLAGDFVQHSFPATLETAISNGQRCARQLLQLTD